MYCRLSVLGCPGPGRGERLVDQLAALGLLDGLLGFCCASNSAWPLLEPLELLLGRVELDAVDRELERLVLQLLDPGRQRLELAEDLLACRRRRAPPRTP
jgi:hypothetical protein